LIPARLSPKLIPPAPQKKSTAFSFADLLVAMTVIGIGQIQCLTSPFLTGPTKYAQKDLVDGAAVRLVCHHVLTKMVWQG
jgi:hypothetical protein